MAVNNIIPGNATYNLTFLKCWRCGTLYSTDLPMQRHFPKDGLFNSWSSYESCPICGCDTNANECKISPAKFKWIRYWRGIKQRMGGKENEVV